MQLKNMLEGVLNECVENRLKNTNIISSARQKIVEWIGICERDANDLLDFLTPEQIVRVEKNTTFDELHASLTSIFSDL